MPRFKRKLADGQIALAAKLRAEGKTAREIGEVLGISPHNILSMAGLKGTGIGRGHGKFARWKKCQHEWGVVQGLRYPNLKLYGSLRVCVRCRARWFEFFETGEARVDPPVEIDRGILVSKCQRRTRGLVRYSSEDDRRGNPDPEV